MRDVAIARSEFVPGQQAITKLQEFQNDEVLFGYCALPEVGYRLLIIHHQTLQDNDCINVESLVVHVSIQLMKCLYSL